MYIISKPEENASIMLSYKLFYLYINVTLVEIYVYLRTKGAHKSNEYVFEVNKYFTLIGQIRLFNAFLNHISFNKRTIWYS